MTTLKTLTIVAALLAGGISLALAQNGPATGGLPPVAGGAGGYPGYGYAAPGYGYAATAPLYDYVAPGYGYGAVAPATGRSTIIIVDARFGLRSATGDVRVCHAADI